MLYHRSLAVPTEAMLIGNLQANTPPIEERLVTAMGSGPLFLGHLRKLTPAEQDRSAERIRWLKKLRHEVPINEGFSPWVLGSRPAPLLGIGSRASAAGVKAYPGHGGHAQRLGARGHDAGFQRRRGQTDRLFERLSCKA